MSALLTVNQLMETIKLYKERLERVVDENIKLKKLVKELEQRGQPQV